MIVPPPESLRLAAAASHVDEGLRLLARAAFAQAPLELDVLVAGPVPVALPSLLKLASTDPDVLVVTLHVEPEASASCIVARSGSSEARLPSRALALHAEQLVVESIEALGSSPTLGVLAHRFASRASQLDTLQGLSERMLGASSIEEAHRVLLAGVTAGHGLGLHRAALFEARGDAFLCVAALGPGSLDEAAHIWEAIEKAQLSVDHQIALGEASEGGFASLARGLVVRPSPNPCDEVAAALRGASPLHQAPAGCANEALRCLSPARDFLLAHVSLSRPGFSRSLGLVYADRAFARGPLDPELAEAFSAYLRHAGLVWGTLELLREVDRLARTDPLTGLWNRRELDERLAREVSLAGRRPHTLGVLLIDLDHFRDVNNTGGHAAGDAMLRELGALLREKTRAHEVAARLGGDEFALVLPGADLDEVMSLAMRVGAEAKARGLSLSMGGASSPQHPADPAALLSTADELLYESKRAGRGRISMPGRAPTIW
jgi:diguanylate cyclase (GGDEF)-like protein